jgi:hypothetical protein
MDHPVMYSVSYCTYIQYVLYIHTVSTGSTRKYAHSLHNDPYRQVPLEQIHNSTTWGWHVLISRTVYIRNSLHTSDATSQLRTLNVTHRTATHTPLLQEGFAVDVVLAKSCSFPREVCSLQKRSKHLSNPDSTYCTHVQITLVKTTLVRNRPHGRPPSWEITWIFCNVGSFMLIFHWLESTSFERLLSHV